MEYLRGHTYRRLATCLWISIAAILPVFTACEQQTTHVEWTLFSAPQAHLPLPGPLDLEGAVIFDVDGDGLNDFIITGRGYENSGAIKGADSPDAIVWYRRTADRWIRYVIHNDPRASGGVIGPAPQADIDGDGDLDFFGMGASGLVWFENPAPNFDPAVPWLHHPVGEEGHLSLHDLAVADFDDDGTLELIFWDRGVGKPRHNRLQMAEFPKDPFIEGWSLETLWSAVEPELREGFGIGDVDGDGVPDIVGGGMWLKHQGDNSWAVTVIDQDMPDPRMVVADLVEGGLPEIVMVLGDRDSPLLLYECSGDPAASGDWQRRDLLNRIVRHGHTLATADLDGDGHFDIFCGEMGQWGRTKPDNPGALVWILYGDGRGGFRNHVLSVGSGVHEAQVGDLDGDGDPDILAKVFRFKMPRLDIWMNNR